jgi:hypothetical protein
MITRLLKICVESEMKLGEGRRSVEALRRITVD